MAAAFDQARGEVARLVAHFLANKDRYLSLDYKETWARQEFIDPFFIALGWDVRNERRVAPQYREVVTEESLDVEGHRKAPDYTFRVGQTPRFFAEAKKPGVAIKNDPAPAYQLRRYAWSAKLPLSILTDFQELAVYDCRKRPRDTDKASVGRILYLTAEEYGERLGEVWDLFGREAVWSGAFDRFAKADKGKRGTGEVDAEFLKEIEEWRLALARNVALRNPNIQSDEELIAVVQRAIDRLVFLRICEDRDIEEYGQLQALLNGTGVYRRLCEIFYKADHRYNSGLFHFQKEEGRAEAPDELSLSLEIDDKVLKDIIKSLYFPASPYEFSVIPAEVLGAVYEQFLGKVIRLTAGHQAKVEDKPEVKKAGGVYYTPKYIVEYIVKNTVGKMLDEVGSSHFSGPSPSPGKADDVCSPHFSGSSSRPTRPRAPKTQSPGISLRILDPACGSGSFLIGAYQYLLDWYRDSYVNDGPEKWSGGRNPRLAPRTNGEWRLSTAERKRILLDHIYGVDIDPQAVEVTKLSLLLKVLEGESDKTLAGQLQLFQQRALPDLGANIKCGNSLIGPDYFAGRLIPDTDEMRRINPFDWRHEFPEAMKSGGFDCVISNPPYVRSVTLKESDPLLWGIYRVSYNAASAREWDIYLVFVEKALSLLGKDGKLGYIIPNKFLNSQVGENLREEIAQGKHLSKLVHFGAYQVFQGVTTYTCLLFLNRESSRQVEVARYVGPVTGSTDFNPLSEKASAFWAAQKSPHPVVSGAPWEFVTTSLAVLKKIRRWPSLGSIVDVFQGTGTRADRVYLLQFRGRKGNLFRVYSEEQDEEYLLEPTFLKPAFRGRSIQRYVETNHALMLIVPYEKTTRRSALIPEKKFRDLAPRTFEYLRECKPRLDQREHGRFKGEGWYCYGRPQNLDRFNVPAKIVFPDVASRATFSLDRESHWLLDTAYAIVPKPDNALDLRYLLGILNSPLLTKFLRETGTPLRGGYFRMKTAYLNPFPIRSINLSDRTDRARHDRMVALVEQMLELHKRLHAAGMSAASRERYQRQIDATDREIDRLVYDLYGLTEDEIKIVEEGQR